MNWDTVKGDWKQFKGKVKESWGKITDQELEVIAGKRDQLVGAIQKSYGIARDEAERQVAQFEHSCGCGSTTADRPEMAKSR
jgi:uncharacterized protein YjbJ (UPF0337 family)